MKNNILSVLSAGTLACLATTTAVLAQTEVPLETVEGWTIYQGTENLGCVMEQVNADGYLVRMGKTQAGDDFGYIAVYTKDEDVNIIGGVTKEVIFDIDGRRFAGKATGDFRDGYRGAYAEADNANFGEALARQYVLTLNPDGDSPIEISLDGTLKAMAATSECNAYAGATTVMADAGEQAELDAAAWASWNSLMADNNRAAGIAEDAKAVLVFPKITKLGLVVGGEGGNGVMINEDQIMGYYRTSSLSVGAQAGAQSYGYTIMFLTDKALEKFQSKSGFELGVDGSIAVFRAGITAEVDTTNLKVDTVAFIYDEQGLMANWTVEGSRIRPIEN
jgi:lipid-binding SYLF domain-containing protein